MVACGVFARDYVMRELNEAGFKFVSEQPFESKEGLKCVFDLVDYAEKVVVEVCGRDLYNRFSASKTTNLEKRREIARDKKLCFVEVYYTNKTLPIVAAKIVALLNEKERPKYALIVNGDGAY